MVKKVFKKLIFAFILINFLGVLKVNAISFNTNAYSCVYFTNGANAFCTNVVQFTYDTVPYYGADYSYNPDYLDVTGETVLDFRNQSFCSDQSTGGTFKFRLYHNYDFESNPLDYLYLRDSRNGQTFCSSTYVRSGRYSEVSCTLPLSLSNTTLTVAYHLNDLPANFAFTTGVSNIASETCGFSSSDIINNNNQNTNSIINNNNNTTNQIIQNNEQNTQDIIDNQNSNTDKEIKSQQVCSTYTYDNSSLPIKEYNQYMLPDKTYVSNNQWNVTDFIPVLKDKTYTYTISQSYPGLSDIFLLYDTNKNFVTSYGLTSSTTYTFIPSQDGYIVLNLLKSSGRTSTFSGEFCGNGNQALNDSLNNLNDTLNDTSQPNTNQDINDMNDMVASDTPISDLITMPLTLVNAYINGVNSSCSPVNLGNLYGTNLTLPCINLEQRLGTNLWHIIDSLFSLFMCYNIGMLFITAFDGLTSLRDDFEGLYQPRHADTGYQPKHGGGN